MYEEGFLVDEEMRKYLVIYEEAVSHIWLCNRSLLDFLINEEFLLIFLSVHKSRIKNQKYPGFAFFSFFLSFSYIYLFIKWAF